MCIIRISRYAITGMLEYCSTGDTRYSSFGMLEYPRDTYITLSGHLHIHHSGTSKYMQNCYIQVSLMFEICHICNIRKCEMLSYWRIHQAIVFGYLQYRNVVICQTSESPDAGNIRISGYPQYWNGGIFG